MTRIRGWLTYDLRHQRSSFHSNQSWIKTKLIIPKRNCFLVELNLLTIFGIVTQECTIFGCTNVLENKLEECGCKLKRARVLIVQLPHAIQEKQESWSFQLGNARSKSRAATSRCKRMTSLKPLSFQQRFQTTNRSCVGIQNDLHQRCDAKCHVHALRSVNQHRGRFIVQALCHNTCCMQCFGHRI